MTARLDHLVVLAASLDQGVAWSERVLGVMPAAGGTHPRMGTHNRLLRLGDDAYLEIIAIDPEAPPPQRARWFDMDDPSLQASVDATPKLVHFVARCDDARAAVQSLADIGIDRGALVPASRGALQWQITIRPDGARLFDGCLPTLIQWDGAHPCDSLPAAGISLRALRVVHPQAQQLRAASAAIGLAGIELSAGAPSLVATLDTPRGVVELASTGADRSP